MMINTSGCFHVLYSLWDMEEERAGMKISHG